MPELRSGPRARRLEAGMSRMITCRNRVYRPYVLQRQRLHCDGVSLEAIAERRRYAGLTSTARARSARRITPLTRRLPATRTPIHYALKANSTLALLRLLRRLGSRADANSGRRDPGGAARRLRAARHRVHRRRARRATELEFAVAAGVNAINVESPGELDRIAAIAADRAQRRAWRVRVNPDIDAQSHPNISTGLQDQQVRRGARRRSRASIARAAT